MSSIFYKISNFTQLIYLNYFLLYSYILNLISIKENATKNFIQVFDSITINTNILCFYYITSLSKLIQFT